ncbi:hypothetical protein [Terasakiella brassicae]|nr:hypothetical protein [Terasakiella brassicae]
MYAENEHDIITEAERVVWLTMQKIDHFETTLEQDRMFDLVGRIQDHDARCAVFGCEEALNSLRRKATEVTTISNNNLAKLANSIRSFKEDLEDGVFDDFIEGIVNTAISGDEFNGVDFLPKGETPAHGKSVGTA